MASRWYRRAACKDADLAVFFPRWDSLKDYAPARKICYTCPVTRQCLQYALATETDDGMWGGMSPRERRKVQKGEIDPATYEIGHGEMRGTSTGYIRERESGLPMCSDCTRAFLQYVDDGNARRAAANASGDNTKGQVSLCKATG